MAITAALVVQVLAVLTIPMIFLGILYSRTSARQHFQWKHARMTLLMSMAPVLVIFAARDLLSDWLAVLGVVIAVGAVFVLGEPVNE